MGNGELFQKGTKYEIFIGIKDKDSYREILSADDFMKMLTEICEETQMGFSLLTQRGGYSHKKGYTTETSLRIIVVGASEEEMVLLGERMKELVNTDAIMITKSEIEYCFL